MIGQKDQMWALLMSLLLSNGNISYKHYFRFLYNYLCMYAYKFAKIQCISRGALYATYRKYESMFFLKNNVDIRNDPRIYNTALF